MNSSIALTVAELRKHQRRQHITSRNKQDTVAAYPTPEVRTLGGMPKSSAAYVSSLFIVRNGMVAFSWLAALMTATKPAHTEQLDKLATQ